MKRVRAERVVAALRHGSSWPLIVEAGGQPWLAKLRGAAQGPAALVAEVIVAELAEALGLRVAARALVDLPGGIPSDVRHGELRDLLAASSGANLGFVFLDGARDFAPRDDERVDARTAAAIVWLDALVQNPDRTAANPNLLWWRGELWLVDHGATLGFQHDWGAVTEASPRREWSAARHVLWSRASQLASFDADLAAQLSRRVVADAVDAVPDEFLLPLLPRDATRDALDRRRAAYAAFLWKRLKAPRSFVAAAAA